MVPASDQITSFQKNLLAWYKSHHRKLPWRDTRIPYCIWLSEVMLQQTQVKTVIPYYLKFLEQFPAIEDLARADLQTVLKMWEGLGYYARARNFHKAAGIVSNRYKGNVPDDLEIFKSLPGVGDYIAAAVQSIAFGFPAAVVDGNVKRVLARLMCSRLPVNKSSSHKFFTTMAATFLERSDPGISNQAVMELGALICTPQNPKCNACPVSQYCHSFKTDATAQFPKRMQASKVPTRHIASGIVRKDGRLLITRRKLYGLLGGLWEFPGGKVKKNETAQQACIREIKEETGIDVNIDAHLTLVTHAYTHFKIKMDVFYCNYTGGSVQLNGPIDYQWIKLNDIGKFAFPKANHKFIPLIHDKIHSL